MRGARVVATGILAMAILWGGYCAWFYWGDNARQALRPVEVPAGTWYIVYGVGHPDSGNFVVTEAGRRGEVFLYAPIPVALPGDVLDSVEVRFQQAATFHNFFVGVSQSGKVAGVHRAAANWIDDTRAVVEGRELWLDSEPLSHVTLGIRSSLERRVVIESVLLHRQEPGFRELQRLLFTSLVDLTPWSQRSINSNQAGYVPLRISPVLLVVVWILLTGAGLLGWRLLRRRSMKGDPLFTAIVLILLGTLLLDVAWQISLLNRHATAIQDYAGRSAEERRRHAKHGEIYAFMEDLKAELQDETRRMVIFAGSNFGYMRARYFAIPHPVVARKGFHPGWLYRARSGDVIVGIGSYPRLRSDPLETAARGDTRIEAGEWPLEVIEGLEGAWGARSRWLRVDGEGVAELELQLAGEGGTGWVTILLERRHEGATKPWVRRDVFLDGETKRDVTLPFSTHPGARYRIKLHTRSPLRPRVAQSTLRPFRYDGQLEMLSAGGGSAHVLARRLAESSDHAAWEVR